MRNAARIVAVLVVAGFAVPALACGYEKSTTTTMSVPPPPTAAPAPAVTKTVKAKPAKAPLAQKKPDTARAVATTN